MSFVLELVKKAALIKMDDSFALMVKESMLVGGLLSVFEKSRESLSRLTGGKLVLLGDIFAKLSFFCLLFLLAGLGLPQFAEGKEGLALISLAASALYLMSRLWQAKTEEKAGFNLLDLAVGAYFTANIISTFASHYMVPSVKGLSKVVVYIITYFTIKNALVQRKERLPWLIAFALLSGIAVSLYGLYQYKIGVAPLATWEDPSVENKGTRIYSTLGNPNLLAGYLLPLAPLALALGTTIWSTYIGRWQGLVRNLSLPMSFAVTALLGLAIVLTGSRGGYLSIGGTAAFVLLALSFYFLSRKPKLIFPTLICLGLMLAAGGLAVHFLAPSLETRILSIFAGSEHSSNAYRMHVWRASLAMFQDNWWLGVGPGNTAFRLAYGLYMKSGFDALGTYCVPLEVGVETGLFGLFSAGAIILMCLSRAHLIFYSDSSYRYLALGLAAALVALMIQGLVDTVFYRPQVHFIFWFVVAAISALSSTEIDKIRRKKD